MASDHQTGTGSDDDYMLQYMREAGIPLTRQNWIDIAYPGLPPKEWGAEPESELPKFLQKDVAED